MDKTEGPRETQNATPSRIADTTPPLPSGDYSYVLEIVMGMQLSIGKLMEAVESLKGQAKHHGDEIDQIGKDVHAAKVALYVVGVMVASAVAFLGWAITTLLPYISKAPAK